MADWYGKKMSSNEYQRLEILHPDLATKIRSGVIKEIQAFASEYGHEIEGRDVIIVEQLLKFLEI